MGATTSYVATTGTCSSIPTANVGASNCAGQWSSGMLTCTIQKPEYTAAQCASAMGMWAYKAGYAPTTSPPPPPCACTTGSACPTSRLCGTCLINGVCTSAFTTSADCTMFNNGARWCGK
ncbi:hypothetical protein ACHHYP_20603 [Achlya hypogyna]|uniref:Uncharacterized protein n=1 Tax=Achlya hypogyna TaxID=1202772 RepID=A0A1V9ZH65_ACHHY|nr:hypothetical protein ACHHYP_20603 [Achlya hypogyna]